MSVSGKTGNTISATRKWLVLAGFVALCLAVGGVAGWATSMSVEGWYRTIAKPDWTPPGWLFGPVWTTLYILMGVAAWRVWLTGDGFGGAARTALIWFFIQLTLNFAWSFAFFSAQSPALGLLVIIALWLSIMVTMVLFWRLDRWAGLMFVPYICWVSFATALNFAIWLMN